MGKKGHRPVVQEVICRLSLLHFAFGTMFMKPDTGVCALCLEGMTEAVGEMGGLKPVGLQPRGTRPVRILRAEGGF